MMIPLTPQLALVLIAGNHCHTFTTGLGSCFKDGTGRTVAAQYGADAVCDACIAWAALLHSDTA